MPYPWHHPLLHQDATISGSIKATLLGLTLLELRLTHAPAFTLELDTVMRILMMILPSDTC